VETSGKNSQNIKINILDLGYQTPPQADYRGSGLVQ
jgi:hypothetical protein